MPTPKVFSTSRARLVATVLASAGGGVALAACQSDEPSVYRPAPRYTQTPTAPVYNRPAPTGPSTTAGPTYSSPPPTYTSPPTYTAPPSYGPPPSTTPPTRPGGSGAGCGAKCG